MKSFKVTNVNDLELIYSILRERYPENEIGVLYNWNIKEYTISVTDKTFKYDPEIHVDINIQVVYGDSVTGDTPLLLKKNGLIYIESIESIFDISKKEEYPGFKMFDKTIRLEKEFSTTDYQVWTDIGWVNIKKVIRHHCNKKIFRVLTHSGCVDVTEDHSLVRFNLDPIKPGDLKVGDSLLHSFPTRFDETHDSIKKIANVNFDTFTVKSKIEAQRIYYSLKNLGFNLSIHNTNDNTEQDDVYIINKIKYTHENETIVKKIIDKGTTNDYVYDLETEIGRFGCGIGQLQAFNTDSIFIKFKYNREDFEKNRRDTFRLATVCGDNLTNDIFKRPPIELEFEKVFHPFILLTKKRYIANKFENTKDPFQLKGVDAKGIALTRRDYCPMVKKCYKEIIDTIVNDKTATGELVKNDYDSLKTSTELYKQYINNIYNYNIDIKDLVVSAMLAASYKTRPVHVQLAERLKLRKQEVQVGDRIPYIFIESIDTKRSKSELGEDPQYAIENNLKYNRTCYLEQLAKPILGFYKIALKDREDLLDEIINYTNNTLIKCGGKALKPSDFKIDE
jgi:hypothetical protein